MSRWINLAFVSNLTGPTPWTPSLGCQALAYQFSTGEDQNLRKADQKTARTLRLQFIRERGPLSRV